MGALVEHRDHVNTQGTQWVICDQLRDACLAAQSAPFISWRTVTSMSHHELVQRTRLDNQYTLHMQQLRNDWHGINASNPEWLNSAFFIQMQTEIASFAMDCHGLHAAKDATAALQ